MKAEEVVLVAATGAGVGAAARNVGITTGNVLYDVVLGGVIAFLGWYTDYDGISDFVEGFGIGFALDAAL